MSPLLLFSPSWPSCLFLPTNSLPPYFIYCYIFLHTINIQAQSSGSVHRYLYVYISRTDYLVLNTESGDAPHEKTNSTSPCIY